MSRRDEVLKYFNKYREETDDRVACGIEQNRKGYTKITLEDKDGNPIVGTKIKAKQKKHEFLYGANLFMLDELETEEKNKIYKESFKKIFNEATLPFYWSDLEPEQGKPRFEKNSPKVYRRPAPDLCLEYCEANGITPKEHCLTYFNFQPAWVDAHDIKDMKLKLEKRYKELAERYAGRIHGWEVLNELLCTQEPWDTRNDFFKADDVIDWNFELAKKYFPHNELIINEATQVWAYQHFAYNRSEYYLMIKDALSRGVRIDTVGMQYHMFDSEANESANAKMYYNPMRLFEIMDQYEKLGKPLQITEITIPAYSNDKENELIQADLIEELYKVWFSHKSVEAIIYWNLVDGYAAWAPQGDMTSGENVFFGGLMRFDMSKKPAYDRIDDLFNKRWRTETEIETNGDGIAKLKGFYGEYEIDINGEKRDIKLSSKNKCGNEIKIVL